MNFLEQFLIPEKNEQINNLINKYPVFFDKISENLNNYSSYLSNLVPTGARLIPQIIEPSNIINQADSGLWYNWAMNVGNKYVAVSYSAGVTYIFNGGELKRPQILIFNKCQISNNPTGNPLYSITIDALEGIRSIIVVDNVKDPYVIFGSFSYSRLTNVDSYLYKWNFISNTLENILTIENTSSIRTIVRHIHKKRDAILFATQTNSISINNTYIYLISTEYVTKHNDITNYYKTISLQNNNISIIGDVWSFTISNDTIYISIPLISADDNNLTGFNSRGRLYYTTIKSFYTSKILDITDCFNVNINLNCIIGNDFYPAGFSTNSISTFQVETNNNTDIVYIYSLSDFVYQFESLRVQLMNSPIQPNITLLDIISLLRESITKLDIDGTHIYSISKKSLYKNEPILVTTIIGNPSHGTINKSSTTNGYNNFCNVYTWSSTSNNHDFYFGTLDIRDQLYILLVNILVNLITDEYLQSEIKNILLSLPQEIIILITEFFLNEKFVLPINFIDKKLYFDIIKIDSNQNISKITSNGFCNNNNLSNTADDGVRNLKIVKNNNDTYLLIGSTCYQSNNSAKLYTIKL